MWPYLSIHILGKSCSLVTLKASLTLISSDWCSWGFYSCWDSHAENVNDVEWMAASQQTQSLILASGCAAGMKNRGWMYFLLHSCQQFSASTAGTPVCNISACVLVVAELLHSSLFCTNTDTKYLLHFGNLS